MYWFVSGIQHRDMLFCLQVTESYQDNAVLAVAMLPNFERKYLHHQHIILRSPKIFS
jgi:hypothetical protein